MDLHQDFYEFFTSLINHDVRFLVVGGYAMAAHGHPRFTKDLDVWVWMDPANGAAVMAAVDEFGFGSLGLTAADFNEPDTVVQLGYPPHAASLGAKPAAPVQAAPVHVPRPSRRHDERHRRASTDHVAVGNTPEVLGSVDEASAVNTRWR
jgi:hypothetical protein